MNPTVPGFPNSIKIHVSEMMCCRDEMKEYTCLSSLTGPRLGHVYSSDSGGQVGGVIRHCSKDSTRRAKMQENLSCATLSPYE